tara:strand:+ start:3220 stop:4455 length:1236 start_codon:yes stop_codon:yes gene_type:complete
MHDHEKQSETLEDFYSGKVVTRINQNAPGRRAPVVDVSRWGIEAYEGYAEPIKWVIEGVLPQQTVGLIASMGGVGKSYMMLDLAVRVAAGPGVFGQSCFGGKLVEQGVAIMITAEDSRNAIHRRLNQIITPDQHKKLAGNLFIVPLADAGGTRSYLDCIGGQYSMTAAWDDMCSEVVRLNATLTQIDPMQAVVAADINSDPAAAQCYWSSVSQLSAETASSVLTAHHMRKDGAVDGVMSARGAIRGSSALVDGCRWAYALFPVGDDERRRAEKALGESIGPLDLIYGAVVKSNEFGMGDLTLYRRDPASGLLLDITDQIGEELAELSRLNIDQIQEIFFEVVRRWDSGDPFSPHHAGKERYICNWMVEEYGLDKTAAKNYLDRWLSGRYLVRDSHPKTPRAQGLRRRETPE